MFNGKLKAEIASLKAQVNALVVCNTEKDEALAKAEEMNKGYEAATRLNRQLRTDAEHTAKVLTEQLQGKVDQAAHYREALQEIRGMATPGANATVKRMAAKAEYALQTYACVQAEAA